MDLQQAQVAGEHGMRISMHRAERDNPAFSATARKAILRHLRDHGACSGENLTDIAQAHGAHCADSRAFGAVFQALAREGLIKKIGYVPRKRGHGAPGPIWILAI